ncbi:hypothetical protein C8R31_10286 [Nitrosospira sp. Nsp2]|uniref:hypothetical protein n=1 Tax=Nitrosospira sp. Nsp2 TaxID=136548 RepID=UPI000D315CAE|nr:hypothetical protein [Nitrosospira sp. Nsp2]PTR16072.1 hypothetical protein C8R31_10286 [Nitrosospira sp. Nsp2]
MREILEVIESRIKSPVLGYFIFAFVAINWKVIFYLFVENKSALDRISYFESNTDFVFLLILPAIAAGIFSVAYPWINYFFLHLCIKPTELKNSVQARTEHNLLVVKQGLENIRSEILSRRERELIDRAKRDEELNKIEDQEIKEKLKSEIGELRIKGGAIANPPINPAGSTSVTELLDYAARYRELAKTAGPKENLDYLARAREAELRAHQIVMGSKQISV